MLGVGVDVPRLSERAENPHLFVVITSDIVPGERIELSRPFGQLILSQSRLPFRHPGLVFPNLLKTVHSAPKAWMEAGTEFAPHQ